LGLHNLLWQGLAYLNSRLSLGGNPCVGDLGGYFLWGERKPVYENGCKLNLVARGRGHKQDIMLL